MIGGIWGDEPPRAAAKNVQTYISTLRKALPAGTIETTPSGYRLQLTRQSIDIGCFEEAVLDGMRAVQAGEPTLAIRLLREALETWRGEPLLEISDQPVGMAESARLAELRRAGEESLIDARLDAGEHAAIIGALEAATGAEPLREKRWAQLMLALYRSGRQADALRAFQRLATTLGEELGIAPSRELRELEEAILQQDQRLEQGHSLDSSLRTNEKLPSGGELNYGLHDQTIAQHPQHGGKHHQLLAPLGANLVPIPAPLRASESAIRCVGREQQLNMLTSVWKQSVQGSRRAIFIGGEPGIGKTRLVSEFALAVHADGATVLYGRSDEDLGVPYQPFAEALRHYITHGGSTDLASRQPNLTRVLPELGLRTSSAALPGVDPGIERWCLFEDVAEVIELASADRPLVLVLEDLHWAADPSLLLLRHLVRGRDPAALLVVGTFRDTEIERSHALSSVLADFRPDDGVTRVSLKGLDKEGVLAYLEASTGYGLDDQGRSFAATLHDEAHGNPLFIGEVIRHLAEIGVVGAVDGHWTFHGDPSYDVPPSIKDVISRRVGRLPPTAQTALSVAACCGTEFELRWLETVLNDGDAILQGLDRAVDARIVDELPTSGRYNFSHALIRRTLYEQLSLTRRSRIHGQIGLAIEEAHSDDLAPFFATLCFHFANASDPQFSNKAASYALAAAQRGLSQLAVEETLDQVTVGMDLLTHEARPDRALRADLQLARAQALLFLGQIGESKIAAAAAAQDARAIRSPARLVAAAAARGWHSTPGDSDPLLPQLCDDAIHMAGSGDPEVRSRALATLAVYRSVNEGQTVEAGPLAAESLALARSLGDPYVLWQALYARSHVLWPTELISERLSIAEEMVTLASDIEEVEPRHQSLYFRGVVRLEGADRTGFEADLSAVEGLATDHRKYWVPAAVSNLWQTLLCLLDGRIADAETRVFAGLEAVPKSDLIFGTALVAQLFAIRREQGRLDELMPGFDSVMKRHSLPAIHAGVALAYAELGDLDRARGLLDRLSADGFAALRRDSTWTIQLADMAELVRLVGGREHAASVYQYLAPKAGELIVSSPGCFCAGAVDRYLGKMADLSGQFETARRHFERALDLETSIGSEPLTAHTKVSYARMLLGSADHPDRALAIDLIAQALTVCRRLALVSLEQAAVSLQSNT